MERPSEGSKRNSTPIPQVGRGGKASSAAAAPVHGGTAAKALRGMSKKVPSDENLPQADRYSDDVWLQGGLLARAPFIRRPAGAAPRGPPAPRVGGILISSTAPGDSRSADGLIPPVAYP